MLQLLKDEEEFNKLIESNNDFIIFKHSTRCNISNRGCKEVFNAVDGLGLDNIYLVDVLQQRDLARYVATYSNIKHESPQLVFFSKGKGYAYASHGQVNERNIRHILGGGWAGK